MATDARQAPAKAEFTVDALGVDQPALAKRITEAAVRTGKTSEQLAREIGITTATWNGYASGIFRVGVMRIPKVAAALGISVQWLLFGSGAGATRQARDTALLLVELADAVDHVVTVAEEIERVGFGVPGGEAMGAALAEVVAILTGHDPEYERDGEGAMEDGEG